MIITYPHIALDYRITDYDQNVILLRGTNLDKWEVEIADKIVKKVKYVKQYFFDDIEHPLLNYKMPSKEDVYSILEFATHNKNVIVSCKTGFTKSPAIAYIISCLFQDPEFAISVLKSTDLPNSEIVRLGSIYMNDPSIYEYFNEWRSSFSIKQ